MHIIHLYTLVFLNLIFQSSDISFHLDSRTLSNGKMVVVKADVYYKSDEGKMVTHYIYPLEYIIIANNKGEAQIYNPKDNTVILKRSLFFSTDIDNINIFLRQRYLDLGLKEVNFRIESSKNQKNLTITTWIPEKSAKIDATKIELVHENNLPIYMAIYNSEKIFRKIYYSNYNLYGHYYLPERITDISYVKNDSVISKKEYSNFKIGVAANSAYLNFKVPANAKIIQNQ